MGRYYKTASANPLDYMYKIDAPLMERSLMANDAYITQSIDNNNKTGELANYSYLAGDEEDALKITGEYQNKVKAITDTITGNPADWRSQTKAIDSLRQDLATNYRTGAISKQVANYTKRKEGFDKLDKQVALYNTSGGKKGVSPEDATAYKNSWDSSFTKTGYDPSKPHAYNVYKAEDVMDNIDIESRLSEGFEKLKANGVIETKKTLTNGEEYFNKKTDKWEGLTPGKILSLVTDNFTGDQQLQSYLRSRSSVGALRGIYYDEDVKDPVTGSTLHRKNDLITPYSVSTGKIAPQEQAQMDKVKAEIASTKNPTVKAALQSALTEYEEQLKKREQLEWNPESGLAPIFRGIQNKYSYSKTENSEELSGGTNWGAKFNQANINSRFGAQMAYNQSKDAVRNQQIDDRLGFEKDKFEFTKEQFEWKKANPTGKGATSTGLKTPTAATVKTEVAKMPTEAVVSNIETMSFANNTTTGRNGDKVKEYSTVGVTSDIARKKGQIAAESEAVNRYDRILNSNLATDAQKAAAKAMKQKSLINISTYNSELNEKRDLYAKVTTAALNNHPSANNTLAKDDIELYHEFANDVDGVAFKKHIVELEKKFPKVPLSKDEKTGLGVGKLMDSTPVKEAKEKLSKYYAAQKRVNTSRENIFKTIRADVVDASAIIPTKQESDDLWEMISQDPTGLKLFNDYGITTSDLKLDNDGIGTGNTSASFAGGLANYIKVNDVGVILKKIGTSTKIGSGNGVVEVQFIDKNGELPSTPMYITLTPEMTKKFGTKFKTHKNPDVSGVANTMLNDNATFIRNQLIKPGVSDVVGVTGDVEGTWDIHIPTASGKKLKAKVTKTTGNGFILQTWDENGKLIPFPSNRKYGQSGFYDNQKELIDDVLNVKDNGQ